MGGKGKVFDHRHYWPPSCVLVPFRISAAAIGWLRAPPPVSLQLARATDVLRVSNGLSANFTQIGSIILARKQRRSSNLIYPRRAFCAFQSEEFAPCVRFLAAAVVPAISDIYRVVIRRIPRTHTVGSARFLDTRPRMDKQQRRRGTAQ